MRIFSMEGSCKVVKQSYALRLLSWDSQGSRISSILIEGMSIPTCYPNQSFTLLNSLSLLKSNLATTPVCIPVLGESI